MDLKAISEVHVGVAGILILGPKSAYILNLTL